MNTTTRLATPEDGPRLGEIHVQAWRAAYQGVIPDPFLRLLDPATRGREWTEQLGRLAETDPATLVTEADGSIVAMCSVGPFRRLDNLERAGGATPGGEVWMINAHPDAFGTGAGTAMLGAGVDELVRQGHHDAGLWVVEQNQRARRFYQREGWTHDGTSKTETIGGLEITELLYRRDLPASAAD